ncbi:MAG: MASE3 domain-containing protein [Lautropia sp.]
MQLPASARPGDAAPVDGIDLESPAWIQAGGAHVRNDWQGRLVLGAALLLGFACLLYWLDPTTGRAWFGAGPWAHALLEMATIVCFATVAVIAWNAHGVHRPARPTVLAVAFVCAAGLDLLHVLATPGSAWVPVPHAPIESLWLWLFARCFTFGGLLTVSLMDASTVIGTGAARRLLAGAVALAAAVCWIALAHPDAMPVLHVAGTGPTAAKIGAEIALAALGFAVAAHTWFASKAALPLAPIDGLIARGRFAASAVLAMGQLCLAGYGHAGDSGFVLGHLYNLAGAMILYRIVLVRGIRIPYEALRLTSRAVQYRQRQLDAIIDSAISAIITVDADFRIRVFNRAAERMFGCSAAEVLGGPIDRFMPPEVRARHEGWMRAFGESGAASREIGSVDAHDGRPPDARLRTVTALRADGTVFPAQASISHVESNGEHLYTVILRDASVELQTERALRESYEDLRALSAQLLNVREDERGHLARELHDDLGQMLAAMRMDIAALQAGLADARRGSDDAGGRQPVPGAAELLASLDRISSAAVRSSRRLIADLRPPAFDDGGLPAALQRLAEEFDGREGLRCRVAVDGDCDAVGATLSLALYRIAQESLNNVVRHARARNASVRLRCSEGRVRLVVVDDGEGMPQRGRRRKDAFGLVGMRERVHALGGSFSVGAEPGGGTRVSAEMPLQAPSSPAR